MEEEMTSISLLGRRIAAATVLGATVVAGQAAAAVAAPAAHAAPAAQASFDWPNATIALPFRNAEVPLQNMNHQFVALCPRVTAHFAPPSPGATAGVYVKNGFEYWFTAKAAGDVNGDGVQDIVAGVSCANQDGQAEWNYVYTVKNGKPSLLGFLTADNSLAGWSAIGDVHIVNGHIDLKQTDNTSDVEIDRTFTWDGHKFTADKPLPHVPGADIAV
jgi:hypothetical protein